MTLGESSVLQDIVAALPDAAIVMSSDGRVLHSNARAQALMPGLFAGAPIIRVLRAPEVLDAIRRAQPGLPTTTAWHDRVPVERLFAVHVAVIGKTTNDPVLLVLRDQSDMRRAEQMRTDFVANASHELRTPLASLLGFLETLQGPARDDPTARTRFLVIMTEQAQRMSRLIDDLLSLSRIEQTLHVQPSGIVDLSAVARQTCDALAPVASDAGARLRCDAPRSVPVRGDHDDLLRVADNLIENAIKHGGAGDVIVETRIENGTGVLRVLDHGPGVAPHHIPRLTERFYRVDSAQSRAKGGTGLGLAIVKHIVARHRGRLGLDASGVPGLRVSVALPLADAAVTKV